MRTIDTAADMPDLDEMFEVATATGGTREEIVAAVAERVGEDWDCRLERGEVVALVAAEYDRWLARP